MRHCSVLHRLLTNWEAAGARDPFTFADLAEHLKLEASDTIELVQNLYGVTIWNRWFVSVVAGNADGQVLSRQAVLLLAKALERLRDRYVAPTVTAGAMQDVNSYDEFVAAAKRCKRDSL